MKHGTVARSDAGRRVPEMMDMRRLFDLPTWFAPFETMRMEEEMTDDAFVVRAEMPGIDPDKDADIWIADGVLHIKVERTMEEKDDRNGMFRTEFGYGSYHRAVTLPKGTGVDDITATYKDGVLEVTAPMKKAVDEVAKVKVTKQ